MNQNTVQGTNQSSHSTEDRAEYSSKSPTSTNTRIFGVMIIISQIAIGVIYGLLVDAPIQIDTTNFGNFHPIFLTFATYFLVIVGII